MLIVGAGGFARELFDVVLEKYSKDEIAFYDDVNAFTCLFGCVVLKNEDEVQKWFKEMSTKFCLGIGNPILREKLALKFNRFGGALTSVVSEKCVIGKEAVTIGVGATILHHATIANGVEIGKGTLIYHNVQITHDCKVGDFCELSPGAVLLGYVEFGDRVSCGANATVLPKLKIADEVVIGAGSVVTNSVFEKKVLKGNPAK